ncbi:uncharacterized protein FOMMEDRAFT_161880 [Fomitiporia mediterranea MF3/22]|uniref:uncharacterized protein n=1 Tax=Fomitiporia mediterranea (strain MF3/22) TaxID=694068 RepID=UPI0004407714|nr:uncharacterized protein FOMMEDRAFT_161880 [Fomitiporia mediterranea MF3/22]EJC98504.1 hypothetical protein FOMMEDRAFT_161880 [Fomitiporia mediterranea MF3/22]
MIVSSAQSFDQNKWGILQQRKEGVVLAAVIRAMFRCTSQGNVQDDDAVVTYGCQNTPPLATGLQVLLLENGNTIGISFYYELPLSHPLRYIRSRLFDRYKPQVAKPKLPDHEPFDANETHRRASSPVPVGSSTETPFCSGGFLAAIVTVSLKHFLDDRPIFLLEISRLVDRATREKPASEEFVAALRVPSIDDRYASRKGNFDIGVHARWELDLKIFLMVHVPGGRRHTTSIRAVEDRKYQRFAREKRGREESVQWTSRNAQEWTITTRHIFPFPNKGNGNDLGERQTTAPVSEILKNGWARRELKNCIDRSDVLGDFN